MTRAFYAMPVPHRSAFRAAVASVRDSHPGTTHAEAAFLALDVDRPAIERTHTLELHARVAERLALTPEADRAGIEAALFGEVVLLSNAYQVLPGGVSFRPSDASPGAPFVELGETPASTFLDITRCILKPEADPCP